MNIKEILEFERYPFNEDVLNDDMQNDGYGNSRITHLVRLLLLEMYYSRLFEKIGIQYQASGDLLFLNKKSRGGFDRNSVFYAERKNTLNVSLFEAVMNWSSWDYGVMTIEMEKIESVEELGEYLEGFTGTCNKLKTCSNAEWSDMLLEIPELCIDSTESLYDVELYMCWNKKLAAYLNYRNCNHEVVNTTFKEGNQEISRIIHEIRDPLQIANGLDYSILMPDRYLLGFYEGGSDECIISFNHLHLHFCSNMVALELLLNEAVQLFGL